MLSWTKVDTVTLEDGVIGMLVRIGRIADEIVVVAESAENVVIPSEFNVLEGDVDAL